MSLTSFVMVSQNPITIPGTIESTNVNLTLQTGTFQFFPGQNTSTMGANGSVLGPTLIMNNGDNMNINITNNLGEDTTIHWHGMHVSAANDGGPHTVIGAGQTWNPQFEVMDKAGTYWYHPHLLNHTDEHVSKGISGFIIVKDTEETALNLPRSYGVDDFPLAVQTKSFDDSYQIKSDVNDDTALMVNATMNGQLDVPAQVVRLRLLNGSSQRTFNFGLTANRTFHLIGTDGGLVNTPLALTRLPLSPGARAEILVDFSGLQGQTIHLMSYASELTNGNYGATYPGNSPSKPLDGYNPNPLNGADFNVLQMDVVAQTASPITTIPSTLVNDVPLAEVTADETRSFRFAPLTSGSQQLNGDFSINGVTMDMNVINVTVPLNNTEIWTLENFSAIAHPFHIHDVQFYILDINGSPPPLYLQGRKDTFMVPSGATARIITKFKDHFDDTIPYMYHCHMLKHEDALAGMMGQFVVVDQTAGLDDLELSKDAVLYPNPSKGSYMTVKLQKSSESIKAYSIINQLGQIVRYHKVHQNEFSNMYSFPIFELAQGQYFIKVFTEDRIITKKFTKNH
ncbi:multicopper oxidase domain-containing protein [Pontimicrobium aquaticum]|nr:multicopper oxidase domain-containing protein [Pontimicrobium aquaticum]